jgi:hypothetical protein
LRKAFRQAPSQVSSNHPTVCPCPECIPSIADNYPEIYGPSIDRYLPQGRLADYQRHKLRVYGTYTARAGRFGAMDISPIWRVNSAQVYSLFADGVPLTAIQLARNPGYPANDINPSKSDRLFFGDRGAYNFKGYGLFDLALIYPRSALRPGHR